MNLRGQCRISYNNLALSYTLIETQSNSILVNLKIHPVIFAPTLAVTLEGICEGE